MDEEIRQRLLEIREYSKTKQHRVIKIINNEKESTADRTYSEYLRYLTDFLIDNKKDLNNFEQSINDFKNYLVNKND